MINIEDKDEKLLVDKYIELEIKLVSCLQHHRLSLFKPRILALALVSLEVEKEQVQHEQMNYDWLPSISYLQQLAKVDILWFWIESFLFSVHSG